MHTGHLRVGFIGLGSQGGPMAHALIDAGFVTSLWARRREVLASYGATAALVDSPAELALRVDLVGICVLGDADVEEVVLGPRGLIEGLRPGSIVAIHSTVHPETCVRVAGALAKVGAEVLDAPVSGGGGAAAARKLLVMVGGDSDVLERARPMFQAYGDPIVHLGALGSGQTAKLANNLLFMGNMSLAHQAVEIGARLGLDPASLTTALQHGSSRSFALDIYAGMRPDFGASHNPLQEVVEVLSKDLRLFAGLVTGQVAADARPLTSAAGLVLDAMAGGGGLHASVATREAASS